jgi:hypothetical protein
MRFSVDKQSLLSSLTNLKARLQEIEQERNSILKEIETLQSRLAQIHAPRPSTIASISQEEKLSIFQNLFKGREDVYPKLWTSKKTGAKGYSPVCEKEWAHYVDPMPIFEKMFKKRMKTYKALGYEETLHTGHL